MPKDWGAAVKYLGLWTGIGLAGWGLAGGRTAPQMEQAYPEDRAARLCPVSPECPARPLQKNNFHYRIQFGQ